ncbi:MAG: mechanosensitive ion channel family protein [Myxococcota bacterium]
MIWDWIEKLARAVAILAVAWLAGGWIRGPLARVLEGRIDPTIRVFLVGALTPLLLALALPAALDQLGVSVTSIIALLSTAGLAIALALKESLSNVASGALILTTRPFRVGDSVTVAGVTGRVRRIGVLTTEVDADDGRRVNVTNDKVLTAPMELHAAEGRVRVEVMVRMPRRAIHAGLLDRIRRVTASIPHAEPRADAVVPMEFEGDLARFAVRVWAETGHVSDARAALFLALNEAIPSTPDT